MLVGDYKLDCGEGRRLDSFCGYVIDRPDLNADMKRSLSISEWKKKTHARFIENNSHSGTWEVFHAPPENWVIPFSSGNLKMKLTI